MQLLKHQNQERSVPVTGILTIPTSNRINVARGERIASAIGGGLLTLLGLKQRSIGGLVLSALGGYLVYRSATGHDPIYERLDFDTSEPESQTQSVRIVEQITVNKPRGELYAFWRDVEHLPLFMRHLESVKHVDQRISLWTARLPKNMGTLNWRAEVYEDQPGELIAWRSLEHADIHNAGEVRFKDAPGDRGTEIQVTIEYSPPAAQVGVTLAGLFNPLFSQMIKEDIRRFKSYMEAGEVPTIEGQPDGRKSST